MKTSVDEWADWSLTQNRTVEEIKERIITKGIESVCFAYLCSMADLNDNNIEEFIALSTGLITDYTNYKNRVKRIISLIESGDKRVHHRINWTDIYIHQGNVSKSVVMKYAPNILESVKINNMADVEYNLRKTR